MKITVAKETVRVEHLSGPDMKLLIRNNDCDLKAGASIVAKTIKVDIAVPTLPGNLKIG